MEANVAKLYIPIILVYKIHANSATGADNHIIKDFALPVESMSKTLTSSVPEKRKSVEKEDIYVAALKSKYQFVKL